MKITTLIWTISTAVALAGCKIVQMSTSGGSITSDSGDYNCAEDTICEIDIPNGDPFSETFTAVTRYGYAFAGWRGTESYLCAGSAPTCTVEIPGSITAYDATGYMTAVFYHQPELIYPGTIAVEYGVWSDEVTLESGGATVFADDFDGDGDDDVVFTTGTYPGEEFTDSREGVILINDGDYSFTVAEGDRPDSVHPREVLMADFNGDGRNDFFIADHGYDVNPYPGWSNQLLLATETGYDDASDRLPDDSTGFTHNAAVGDFNGDATLDIVPQNYAHDNGNVLAWLNDGTGHYVALKTTMFSDAEALFRLTWGVKVREGDGFKAVEFFTVEDGFRANAGVVVDGARITLATASSPPEDTP